MCDEFLNVTLGPRGKRKDMLRDLEYCTSFISDVDLYNGVIVANAN